MHEGYHMEEKEAYTNSQTQGILNGVLFFFLKYSTLKLKTCSNINHMSPEKHQIVIGLGPSYSKYGTRYPRVMSLSFTLF